MKVMNKVLGVVSNEFVCSIHDAVPKGLGFSWVKE